MLESGFEFQCCILDGHDIFTLICCKNCIICLKRLKINKKGAGVGTFLDNVDTDGLLTVSVCCHQNYQSWVATIAQWINLRPPSCGPTFESKAFFN